MASEKQKVRTIKAQVLKMLSAGLASDFISKTCNLSPTIVRGWEEEYLKDLLASGAGQRARLRHLLLRNSPQMINTLYKLAMQDVDTKLQMNAATTFLGFASRFLKEDATISQAESKAMETAVGNISYTLFDFVIPGEAKPADKMAEQEEGLFDDEVEEEEEEEDWEIEPGELDYSGSSDESISEDMSS
jgi:hypothetical protein